MAQQTFNFSELIKIVEKATTNAKNKIEEFRNKPDSVGIGDMFEMQILMNQLSQLSEMSTAIVAASNSAIRSMAQNVNR